MRKTIETVAEGYEIHECRREKYDTGLKVPFLVSPTPFSLSGTERQELRAIGSDVVDFMASVNELCFEDATARNLLNSGKPEIFLTYQNPQYLFVRPDLIITPSGFTLCEIETSPFGLALAEILNRAYREEGFTTLVEYGELSDYVKTHTPMEGRIVYGKKTESFKGQLSFLADQVFSGVNRYWHAEKAGEKQQEEKPGNIYRGFYLSEYVSDPSIRRVITDLDPEQNPEQPTVLPSLTPFMEEKAILALLWDTRWEHYFRRQLGQAAFNHLRSVVPPTWIVGEEKYFSPGLPDGLDSSIDLATLSRSKRAFVLKASGFTPNGSWCEGVSFLHEKSRAQTRGLINCAAAAPGLNVIQEFRKAKEMPLVYESETGPKKMRRARVRITPYVPMDPEFSGKLIAVKATACEGTNYIHATSTSINTAVDQS
ncbi:MAG: hypothetical protein M1524_00890 [Patescibacteria group bacterium]|nr:hypothetical protein [Patescibacteria group bacterium]